MNITDAEQLAISFVSGRIPKHPQSSSTVAIQTRRASHLPSESMGGSACWQFILDRVEQFPRIELSRETGDIPAHEATRRFEVRIDENSGEVIHFAEIMSFPEKSAEQAKFSAWAASESSRHTERMRWITSQRSCRFCGVSLRSHEDRICPKCGRRNP